jgi:type IV pilus assembly protein PilX
VMTLLGLACIRATLLEERMSAALYDRSLAFQAAEGGLRFGEAIAASRPDYSGPCALGKCGFPLPGTNDVWKNELIWAAAPAAAVDVEGIVATPRYLVELLADQVPPQDTCTTSGDISESACSGSERRYRITARSEQAGRASVWLQSVYAVP